MCSLAKQTPEQKRKQEKMNMVLSNLEQKLKGNEELCQGIAKVIDMTIENDALVARLEKIESNIPEIEHRISNLIAGCVKSCSQARADVMDKVYNTLLEIGEKPKTTEYIIKTQRTIDYCIAEYPTDQWSSYGQKYSSSNRCEDSSSLRLGELLMLI